MAHPLLSLAATSALAATSPSIIPALGGSVASRVLPAVRSFTTATSQKPTSSSSISLHRPRSLSLFVVAAFSPRMLRFMPTSRTFATPGSMAKAARLYGTINSTRPATVRISASIPSRIFSRNVSGGVSSDLLASSEERANRQPQSPSIQAAFCNLLMSANMPHIVIERYNSGHFARNKSVDDIYRRAVAAVNGTAQAGATGHNAAPQQYHSDPGYNVAQPQSGYSPVQMQAVGQAVAANSQGANIGVAPMPGRDSTKQDPLYVRVDETTGHVVFKWVKFLCWFGLVTYISLILVTMLIDSLNMLPKRGGAKGQQEVKAQNQKTRFGDVHGCDEAKEELQDLVEFLKNPKKFNTLGGKLPKGVLLVGPPGTGKTLLARAVAGEAGVPFFYMSGSEFDEVYVGVGAKRVRELFNSAKAKSPAIIFIDELDAIGSRRNSRDAAYVKQTLNQLLTELDGFEQNSGVIIMGATNFPESLDKALVRPGRFDRQVVVGLPDVRGRAAILRHHATQIRLGQGVDLEGIALTTAGLSGAELANIINEAAVHAGKKKAKEVSMLDLEWAKDKVIMGAERKTMVIDPAEKKMTAYHEAGHALLKWYTNPNTLHKVTILPRGMTLGHMAHHQPKDKYSNTAKDYDDLLLVLYGGYVAEELVFGSNKTTDGVSSDIEKATKMAFRMVANFGMSKGLGPVEFGHMYDHLSAHMKAAVEAEVREKLSSSYQRAKDMLGGNRQDLDRLANALLKYETLDREEIGKVLRGEELVGRTPVPLDSSMVVHPRPEPEEGGGIGGGHGSTDSPSGSGGSPPPPPPPPDGPPLGPPS